MRTGADRFAGVLFGLPVESDRPLPGLRRGELPEGPEVVISFAGCPERACDARVHNEYPSYVSPVLDPASGRPATTAWTLADGSRWLELPDGLVFLVDRAGTRVWVRLADESAFAAASAHLLGPMLGLVLRLRGTTCLHASAVSLHDGVVAFAGLQGAGKSTIAAALAARGIPVLADDVLALEVRAGRIVGHPAYPRVCLRPQAAPFVDARALSPDADAFHLNLDLTAPGYAFETRALPLRAVYLLDPPDDGPSRPDIEPIPGSDALLRLVGDTWATRMLDSAMRVAEFDLLSRLVATVPVRKLRTSTDPSRVDALCTLIVDHAGARA